MTAHCFRLDHWTLSEFITRCLDHLFSHYPGDYYAFLNEKASDLIGLRGGGRRRAFLVKEPVRALVIFLALYDLMNTACPPGRFFGPNPQDRKLFGYWAISEIQRGETGENKEAAPRALTSPI